MKLSKHAPLSLLLALVACRDIVVDTSDRSPPTLELTPAVVAATDEAGEPLEGAVQSGEAFVLAPDSPARAALLVFAAKDEQSSISSMRATLELRFRCSARVIGGDVFRDATATFSVSTNTPDAAGSTVSDTETALVEVSLNEAWRRAGCERWDQIIDVKRGFVSNITGTIRASAFNNAQPTRGVTFNAAVSYAAGRYIVSY